jgi:hypothetical protein
MRARPRPETMKSQAPAYKVTNFFYNKPLVYLGALYRRALVAIFMGGNEITVYF